MEELAKWVWLEASFQMQYVPAREKDPERQRYDWLWSLGYDCAAATHNIFCDGYCRSDA